LPEVDYDQLGLWAGEPVELGLELRPRREIELSTHGDHGRGPIPVDIYAELILHVDASLLIYAHGCG
jgi:hypothetical protein